MRGPLERELKNKKRNDRLFRVAVAATTPSGSGLVHFVAVPIHSLSIGRRTNSLIYHCEYSCDGPKRLFARCHRCRMLNLLAYAMYFTDASFQVDLEAMVVTMVDPVGLVDRSKLLIR